LGKSVLDKWLKIARLDRTPIGAARLITESRATAPGCRADTPAGACGGAMNDRREDLERSYEQSLNPRDHLGPPQRPEGAGYMPYSEAVYWIATKGGAIEIFEIEPGNALKNAYHALNDHIATGEVLVIGRQCGQGTAIPIGGCRFSDIAINYPFSEWPKRRDGEAHVICRLHRDKENWQQGNCDQLMAGRLAEFTHLQVRKSDIARVWPFPSAEAQGNPPRPRHFNQKTAAEFAGNYIARDKEAGHEPTMDGCRKAAREAGYTGGRGLLDEAYRKQMTEAGYNVRRGRRTKNPQKKSEK
jgi:hypothetical protein